MWRQLTFLGLACAVLQIAQARPVPAWIENDLTTGQKELKVISSITTQVIPSWAFRRLTSAPGSKRTLVPTGQLVHYAASAGAKSGHWPECKGERIPIARF